MSGRGEGLTHGSLDESRSVIPVLHVNALTHPAEHSGDLEHEVEFKMS